MRNHPVLLATVPEALSREFFDEASRALLRDAAAAHFLAARPRPVPGRILPRGHRPR